MIHGLTNAGAIPVLERVVQFSRGRHEILTHNIANLSTPEFRPADVSVEAFQQQLGDALDRQRAGVREASGGLPINDTPEVAVRSDGLVLSPQPTGDNILFHDGNDRSVERTMQGLVENFMTFRMASQFIRREFESLNTAIRERL